MSKPYVYITRKLPSSEVEALRQVATIGMWPEESVPVPREVLLAEAEKADALLTMLSDQVDHELLDRGQQLKIISNMAVGYDNIDVSYATQKGIVIGHTPGILNDTTADLTFALLLATARRIVEAADFIRQGQWGNWEPMLLAGLDVHHKTIGIVGMGRIGEAVARRAKGFDMNILYHNRSRKLEAEKNLGATYCSMDDLLKQSDFVVCLTPLTKETEKLFNRETFQKMKKTAVFVNVSRGGVVVEEDLLDALKNGEIAAAGLDVFRNEPISADHPLLSLTNVVALPHIGSASIETRLGMMQIAIQNIIAVLDGRQHEAKLVNVK